MNQFLDSSAGFLDAEFFRLDLNIPSIGIQVLQIEVGTTFNQLACNPKVVDQDGVRSR